MLFGHVPVVFIGTLLKMNRSIQAVGAFGVIKYDRWYKRLVRNGMQRVKLEIYPVSVGFNLRKFYNNIST